MKKVHVVLFALVLSVVLGQAAWAMEVSSKITMHIYFPSSEYPALPGTNFQVPGDLNSIMVWDWSGYETDVIINWTHCTMVNDTPDDYADCSWTWCDPTPCDHPFVAHPDAWDNVELINYDLSGADLHFTKIFMENAVVEVGTGSHIMIEDSLYSGITTVDYIEHYDLSADIDNSREYWIMEAIADACAADTECDPLDLPEWYDLPVLIRLAAMDLGQNGLRKYQGVNYSTSQNGCDDFYGWSLFNGGGDFCDYKKTYHYCEEGWDFSNPCGEDDVCIWMNGEAVMEPGHAAFGPRLGLVQHNSKNDPLLFRLIFETDATGDRIAVAKNDDGLAEWHGVYKKDFDPDPETGDKLYNVDADPDKTSIAEPGEIVVVSDNCPDPFNWSHAWMVLSEYGIEVDGSGVAFAAMRVSSSQVRANYTSFAQPGGINEKCQSGGFKYDYYLGKTSFD